VHDTTTVYDTVKTFGTNTISSDLVGSWSGTVNGKNITSLLLLNKSLMLFPILQISVAIHIMEKYRHFQAICALRLYVWPWNDRRNSELDDFYFK